MLADNNKNPTNTTKQNKYPPPKQKQQQNKYNVSSNELTHHIYSDLYTERGLF